MKRNGVRARRETGLSLIEVLIATVILGYCAYIMGSVIPDMTLKANKYNKTNNSHVLASTLADSIAFLPYSHLKTMSTALPFTTLLPQDVSNIKEYTYRYTVTQDTTNPFLKHVDITISWATGSARYKIMKVNMDND